MTEQNEREIEDNFLYRAREVIGNQRFSRRPKAIANVVNKIVVKRGFAETKCSAQLETVWQEVAGKQMAEQTRLGNVRKGVLDVFVKSSSAMQHYSMLKSTLVQNFKNKYPEAGIENIRFKIGH